MSFIIGLLLGSALTSGSATLPPALGSIPFRCLAALEISDAEYRTCRWATLRSEIYTSTSCRVPEINSADHACSFDRHVAWEIAGLRELNRAIEKKAAQQ